MAGVTRHNNSSTLEPRRFLVRGVNWLGDAVMTTPALFRLRERFPAAQITMLTPGKLAELWQKHPAVNETISIANDQSLFQVGRQLREGRFDLALVFPSSPRSALECWLAEIPERIGYKRPWRNWFLTRALTPRREAVKMRKLSISEINRRNNVRPSRESTNAQDTSAHQMHEYLHLVASLGANAEALPPQLFVSADEIGAARKKFALTDAASVFTLNPGAEYGPAKRWPAERFIAAAREIQQRSDCMWLILGGQADVPIARQIESGIQIQNSKIKNLAGQTSLRELMALLKICRALLTNDSGPMHVAAALGTPVVVPFGSTSPELTGPGLPGDSPHYLLKSGAHCSPCFLRECPIDFRCMNGISVAGVVEAVLKAAAGNLQQPPRQQRSNNQAG